MRFGTISTWKLDVDSVLFQQFEVCFKNRVLVLWIEYMPKIQFYFFVNLLGALNTLPFIFSSILIKEINNSKCF